MNILPITLQVLNDFFTNDPKLCFLGLSDESMDYLYHTGSIVINKTAELYGIYEEDKLICCIEIEPWNKICGVAHMYLASDLHHTGTIRKIQENMRQYLKDSTTYQKILLYIPSPCEHVIMAAKAFGLKHEATITDCIMWRQETVDLVIYGLNLRE